MIVGDAWHLNGLLLSHTVNLRGKNYILIHIRNLFPSIASGELWSNKCFQEPLNIYIGDQTIAVKETKELHMEECPSLFSHFFQ